MKATGRSKSTVLKFSKLIEDWVSTEDDLPQKDPKYKNLSIEVEVKIKKSGNKTTAFYNDKNNKWFSAKTMKVIEVDKWRTATTLNNRQECDDGRAKNGQDISKQRRIQRCYGRKGDTKYNNAVRN